MSANPLYGHLANALVKCAGDSAYQQKLLQDPNGTLAADGVDVGSAKIKMDWVDGTNALNITVDNAGANWNGAVLLKLRK
jgi:hypothetical protein